MGRMAEYRPRDLDGVGINRWWSQADLTDGDFIIEYGVGYPTMIYVVERSKLGRVPFSRAQSETEGGIGRAISEQAVRRGQHAGVVFELRSEGYGKREPGELSQIGNIEITRHGGKVVWTRSKNAAMPGALRADPRIRIESKWTVGDRGAVYQFNVKFHRGDYSADVDDDSMYIETKLAVKAFADVLRERFPWVGAVHLTGRSGGWLAVEDKQGKATSKTIEQIADMVDDAREEFGKYLDEQYSGPATRGRRRAR
jgi:hypothetical protein